MINTIFKRETNITSYPAFQPHKIPSLHFKIPPACEDSPACENSSKFLHVKILKPSLPGEKYPLHPKNIRSFDYVELNGNFKILTG